MRRGRPRRSAAHTATARAAARTAARPAARAAVFTACGVFASIAHLLQALRRIRPAALCARLHTPRAAAARRHRDLAARRTIVRHLHIRLRPARSRPRPAGQRPRPRSLLRPGGPL
eukprot:7383013-Prymnesium_polylepis.1